MFLSKFEKFFIFIVSSFLMIFFNSTDVFSNEINVTIPKYIQIEANSSKGIPMHLNTIQAERSIGCSIDVFFDKGDDKWMADVISGYISLQPNKVSNNYIIIYAPDSPNLQTKLIIEITNLQNNTKKEMTCLLETVEKKEYNYDYISNKSKKQKRSINILENDSISFDVLQNINNHLMGTVLWEIVEWPIGYPYTKDPIVYANQKIKITCGLKNIDASTKNVSYKINVSKKAIIGSFIELIQLNSDSVSLQSGESKLISTEWNVGSNTTGEYRIDFEADSGKINSLHFQIGRSQSAAFIDCESVERSYTPSDTVSLKSTARIHNNGNVDLSGIVQVIVQRYDSIEKKWNLIELLSEQENVIIKRGDTYYIQQPIEYQLPNDSEGDYRLSVRFTENTGLIAKVQDFIIGAKIIGTLENNLPSLVLERSIGEDKNSNGTLDLSEIGKLSVGENKNILVKYIIAPPQNSYSLRSAGHFLVGEMIQTKLDIVFVIDTSGSMDDEWKSLLSIFSDVIYNLIDLADVKFDIYALENYNNDFKKYTVDGQQYDVKILKDHPTGHSESWGPATQYLSKYYNWREDSIKVILPISDECAYEGDDWDNNDTNSINDAITECNNNNIIAYPMYGDFDNATLGQNFIKPNMERLATLTGGQAMYWAADQEVFEYLSSIFSQQVEFAAKNITLEIGLTNNISPLASACDWLDTWSNNGNNVQLIRKTLDYNDSLSTINSLLSTKDGNIERYIFSSNSDNQHAFFQTLSLSPIQQLEVIIGLNLPTVSAGQSYIISGNEDRIIFEDAFTGNIVMFPEVTEPALYTMSIRPDQPTAKIMIVTDENRMRKVYGNPDTDAILKQLQKYANSENSLATFLNVSEFREQWEKRNNTDKNGITYSAFDGVYSLIGVSGCSSLTDWNTNGPDYLLQYPEFLDEIIGAYAIAREVETILLVGSDNIIPFQRIKCPEPDWEKNYLYVNKNTSNKLWSDVPYSMINSDEYPDIAISRLAGEPMLISKTIASGLAEQPSQLSALVAIKTERDNATQNHVERVINTLWNYSFGPINSNSNVLLNEYLGGTPITAVANSQNIRNQFLNRLKRSYPFLFIKMHGNNYRDTGFGTQTFSHHHNGLFSDPSDQTDMHSNHPIISTNACHGGVDYADDLTSNNLKLSFFENGATAFIGCTGYGPSKGGMDFYNKLFSYLFNDSDQSSDISQAVLRARRSIVALSGSINEFMSLAFHHYGLPTVTPVLTHSRKRVQNQSNPINFYEDASRIDINVSITEWADINVETNKGSRTYFSIEKSSLYTITDYPPLPMFVEEITLPANTTISNQLTTTISNSIELTNIHMPKFQSVKEASNDSAFTGNDFSFSENYPEKIIQYELVNEINGKQTLFLKIFPIQYNPEIKVATIHKNISLSIKKENRATQPLINLDLERKYSASSNEMIFIIRNFSKMDAANIVLSEIIPENVVPDLATVSNAEYTNSTLIWTFDSIANKVPDNFLTIGYKPIANKSGNHLFRSKLNYQSSAGLPYELTEEDKIELYNKSSQQNNDDDSSGICFISIIQ